MAIYLPPRPWQGRNDGNDASVQRWHQSVQLLDLDAKKQNTPGANSKLALIGFCSDEGVRRNKGRTGAKDAPACIREACSSFSVHHDKVTIFDAGDILCDDGDLERAQSLLGKKVHHLVNNQYLPLVLGGGHEVAFGNFSGIYPQLKNKNTFGVINFDAHFDLRPVDAHVGATSGTGFWQMAQMVKKQDSKFEYLVIGLQQCSNTRKLFQTAQDLGALYVLAEDFTGDQLEHLLHLINGVLCKSSLVQLSIDMDVFTAAAAPGVSAPAFNGIQCNFIFKRLLRHIISSGKLTTVDIAEVNPVYDADNRTSRLAASFVFDVVQAIENNAE